MGVYIYAKIIVMSSGLRLAHAYWPMIDNQLLTLSKAQITSPLNMPLTINSKLKRMSSTFG
jgi:hypothetical protein